MDVYIGTSGWSYDDWKGRFYPKGYYSNHKHLGYYSQQFNAAETNATFYRFMKDSVIKGWYDKTQEVFKFAIKLHKYFTQTKRLKTDDGVKDRLDSFLPIIDNLGEKAGPVLVQLPPSLKQDLTLLENWLQFMPEYRYAIEFRHHSWLNQDTYDILAKYNAALVFSQTTKWNTDMVKTADFFYARFHGPEEFYYSKYTQEQMEEYAHKINQTVNTDDDVFIFFNNSYMANSVENARQLRHALNAKN